MTLIYRNHPLRMKRKMVQELVMSHLLPLDMYQISPQTRRYSSGLALDLAKLKLIES